MTSANNLAMWADGIRDISAQGLHYAENFYDRERYEQLQELAVEMMAAVVGAAASDFTPIERETFKSPTPFIAGDAAIIDEQRRILLIQRSDNGLWAMPGGAANVGETPAEAAVREAEEESGVGCRAVGLVGVYDNRRWGSASLHHVYMLTFLCEPILGIDFDRAPSHAREIRSRGWFTQADLPKDLDPRHGDRIPHAFEFASGERSSYFDR